MIATVTQIQNGCVKVRTRRNYVEETLEVSPTTARDLRVGDRLEVKRIVNNPYIVFIRIAEIDTGVRQHWRMR